MPSGNAPLVSAFPSETARVDRDQLSTPGDAKQNEHDLYNANKVSKINLPAQKSKV